MEHESFEDEETARGDERSASSRVKVDREERPDVDGLYMTAVLALTGHGGWPMTVFLTPDVRPFYGGTYFPPEPRTGMPELPAGAGGDLGRLPRTRRNDLEQQADAARGGDPRRPASRAPSQRAAHAAGS